MFENKGALDVMTSSNAISLIFDGNKNNVQATGSLINVKGGNLNICNTILQNNNINGYGGAIYASDAELELVNVTLSSNEADFGGAIYVALEESNTNLNNIKIINNKAKTGSGGGIYAYGNLVVSGENTLISNNIAQTFGGGLMVKTAGILNGGEISKNQAISNAGGGIRVDKRFTYNGGIIKENTAGTTGGGIDFTSGILEKKANDVVNNTAKEAGNNIYPSLENNVDWTTDGSLKLKKINMKLLKSYVKNIDIEARGTQGMTVTDKYVLFTLWKSDDDTTMIVIADKNTGEILNIVDDYNFKHANDMTYDSKNDYVYILTSSKKIAKFKINAQYQMTDLQYVTCNRAYSGIAYDKANDRFIGLCARKIYIINNKFEELSTFDVPTNLTTQGIGYYNGNIYYCCTEMGVPCEYQQIYNNKERLSNLIYKYNLKGELVETLYIPNTDLYGEIESCAFEEDGTLVASYNIDFGSKSTVSLYKNNMIPPVLNVVYNITELTNKDVSVTINSNKELQEVTGWTLAADKKSLIKTYSKNTKEDIIVKDLYGNSSIAKINITNIDKDKPILEVNYSTTMSTNQNVIVTIKANEEIKNVEGWTLLEGKKGLTKTYTENKTENIQIIDLAGNISTTVIDIKNIDKQKTSSSSKI